MKPAAYSRRQSIQETSDGHFRRAEHRGQRHAGAGVRAREHLGQHRELADRRLQARGHELPRSDPGRRAEQAVRRQRDRELARHQHDPGRYSIVGDRHLHGDQRRRIFRRREGHRHDRQHPDLLRQRPLQPARRLHHRPERLSRQWRRLLSQGHSRRPDDRQPDRQRAGAASVQQQLPAGAGDHGRSSTRRTCRPIRSRPTTTRLSPSPNCLLRRPPIPAATRGLSPPAAPASWTAAM